MDENLTDSKFTGNLRRCSDFYVTYYWNSVVKGAHLYSHVIVVVMNILLSLSGAFANMALISAYGMNNRLRTLSNMLLVTLACSDLLVTAIVQPLFVLRMLKEILGVHHCLLWTSTRLLSYFCCGVSVLTVVIITIERFITLAYPYRHQRILTRTRLKTVVVSTWLATFVLVISHLGLVPYKILLTVGATLLLSSIFTIISTWVWIHRLLRRHRNNIKMNQMPSTMANKTRNRKLAFRHTKTCYLIVSMALICYFPAFLMMAYFSSEPTNFVLIFVVCPWADTLMFANSFLNPLLVLWRKRDFKETAREFLLKRRCLGQ